MGSDSYSLEHEKSVTIEDLGSLLKNLRKKKGLTQAQLADLIGVKPQTIGKYETGLIKYPPLDKLLLLRDEIDDDDEIIEYITHVTTDFSQSTIDYIDSFTWAVSMPTKIENDFKEYLTKKNIDVGIPVRGNFFSKDIQKLVVAWDRASEKDRKAVSYILGFDYDPKPDNSNEK